MESFVELLTQVDYSELTVFQQESLILQILTFLGVMLVLIIKR